MSFVVLTLLSSFFVQLGYFIWKVAAADLPRIGQAKHLVVLKAFLTSWKWLSGMGLRLFGLYLFIKATEHGPLSLIQPLASTGDAFIILLAVVFLHERLVRLEWVGLFFIVAGAVSLSFEAKTFGAAAINWFHVGIFITCAFSALITLILVGLKKRQLEIFLGMGVGIAFGVSMVLVKLMTTYIVLSGRPVSLIACFTSPIFPFIIMNNLVGLVTLQVAFQNGRAAVIIPLQVSMVSGVAILGGILLFSEVVSLHRMLSIFVILTGAVLLQLAGQHKKAAQSYCCV